jgi:hypothetical protein
MKRIAGFLSLIAFCSGVQTFAADIPPIQTGTDQSIVASAANNIFFANIFRVGSYAYQVVSLDSKLNGDMNTTTMVLVAEKGIGGLAGYDMAFQYTPSERFTSLNSARIVHNEIELSLFTTDGKNVNKYIHYDPQTKTLKESDKIFVPRKIVHSEGKAYTECTDAAEQKQRYKKRQVCVNQQGEFYYLAD